MLLLLAVFGALLLAIAAFTQGTRGGPFAVSERDFLAVMDDTSGH
jgi:hypothetical protein